VLSVYMLNQVKYWESNYWCKKNGSNEYY